MSNFDSLVEISGITKVFPSNSKIFKQCHIQQKLNIEKPKPSIEKLYSITGKVNILNKHIISSPDATSFSLQNLNGNNLIVEGEVILEIEYFANGNIQTIENKYPFSDYIVLDKSYNVNSNYTVTPYIEDIYIRQLDKKILFNSVMFVLDVKYISNL